MVLHRLSVTPTPGLQADAAPQGSCSDPRAATHKTTSDTFYEQLLVGILANEKLERPELSCSLLQAVDGLHHSP